MNLYKLLIGGFTCVFSVLANAQDTKTITFTTAKEVIDKYIEVAGFSVTPYQNCQLTTITKMQSIYSGKTNSFFTKSITVNDLTKETSASIMFTSITNSITRMLTTKEKIYMFEENGKITETPGQSTPELLGIIDLPKLYNLTFLPDKEVFDDEECYVLYSEKEMNFKIGSTSTQKLKTYHFYSVKTGLPIGSKAESTTVMDGKLLSSIKSHYHAKEFSLVENKYLMSHKLIQVMEMIGPSSQTSTTTTVIKYNIDTEQFKNETFKNPRDAIAAIPDEF